MAVETDLREAAAPAVPPVPALRRSRSIAFVLPAAGVVALSFSSGGFFVDTVGTAATVAAGALAARAALARRPFEGMSWPGAATLLALGAYLAWTLVSAIWSDAPARAVVEGQRVLLYLLTFAFMAGLPRRRGTPGALAGWLAAAAVIVCGTAFVTRTLPDVLAAPAVDATGRLSYPMTYWNALGLLAAIGSVLCFHIAADASRPTARALGCAAVPLLTSTLLLTFSRGGLAVALVAFAGYCVLGRPRGLVGALLVCVPAVAIVAHSVLGADVLATPQYASPAGRAEGQDLAATVALVAVLSAAVRLLLSPLDRWIGRTMQRRRHRRIAAAAVAFAVVAAAVAAVAAGAPAEIRDRAHEFMVGAETDSPGAPTRDRLRTASSHGRTELWRVSLDGVREEPWHGTGAGTFVIEWNRHRDPANAFTAVDGHSLYLEVLGELGIPGLVLLLAALGIPLAALIARLRGPERAAWAALTCAFGAWAVHAGTDWDWEMPAVTLIAFAIGGAAVARTAVATTPGDGDRPLTGGRATPLAARVLVVAACAGVAFIPLQMSRSQTHIDRGVRALIAGDCTTATGEGAKARDIARFLPEPYELLGICAARLGDFRAGIDAMQAAVRRDPQNWELHYELAIVRGLAGIDPRPQLRMSSMLNPSEPLNRAADWVRRVDRPWQWRQGAASLVLPGVGETVAPSNRRPRTLPGASAAGPSSTPP